MVRRTAIVSPSAGQTQRLPVGRPKRPANQPKQPEVAYRPSDPASHTQSGSRRLLQQRNSAVYLAEDDDSDGRFDDAENVSTSVSRPFEIAPPPNQHRRRGKQVVVVDDSEGSGNDEFVSAEEFVSAGDRAPAPRARPPKKKSSRPPRNACLRARARSSTPELRPITVDLPEGRQKKKNRSKGKEPEKRPSPMPVVTSPQRAFSEEPSRQFEKRAPQGPRRGSKPYRKGNSSTESSFNRNSFRSSFENKGQPTTAATSMSSFALEDGHIFPRPVHVALREESWELATEPDEESGFQAQLGMDAAAQYQSSVRGDDPHREDYVHGTFTDPPDDYEAPFRKQFPTRKEEEEKPRFKEPIYEVFDTIDSDAERAQREADEEAELSRLAQEFQMEDPISELSSLHGHTTAPEPRPLISGTPKLQEDDNYSIPDSLEDGMSQLTIAPVPNVVHSNQSARFRSFRNFQFIFQYEVTRVALGFGVNPEDFDHHVLPLVEQDLGLALHVSSSRREAWQNLRTFGHGLSGMTEMPVPFGEDVWSEVAGSGGWSNRIELSGIASFMKGSPVVDFRIQLNPPTIRSKTNRFSERFGSDRFLIVRLPPFRDRAEFKYLNDKELRFQTVEWAVNTELKLMNRSWRCFYVRDGTKKTKESGEYVTKNFLQAYFFAETGVGLGKTSLRIRELLGFSGSIADEKICRDDMSRNELIMWHMPVGDLSEEKFAKIWSRVSLGTYMPLIPNRTLKSAADQRIPNTLAKASQMLLQPSRSILKKSQ
jgi:hypothetical protein